MPEHPVVAICSGKDCRRRCEYPRVRAELEARCEVLDLKCVDICAGPVVVVAPTSDTPVVVAKLRSKKQRKHLLRLVSDDAVVSKELARLTVGKRKRAAVLRRVRRALDQRAA